MADQKGGGADDGLAYVVLLVGGIILAYVIWHFYSQEILHGLRVLRVWELKLISLFVDDVQLKLASGTVIAPIDGVIASAKAIPLQEITPAQVGTITSVVGYYFRWPVVVILGLLASWALFATPGARFRKRHNLETLIKAQAAAWPVISPIITFNPASKSARSPGDPVPEKLVPFAEALSPEEWLAKERIPILAGQPSRDAVRKALAAQLGPRWRGANQLPDYAKGIYAACALKGAQKRGDGDELLNELSLCWTIDKGFSLSMSLKGKIEKILKDKKVGGLADQVAARHAHQATAMLGVLNWAREQGGVLAPAQFLWLRAVDRKLWYPLNNLGRQAYHAEAAGALCHYMAERALARPLPSPKMDNAIKALEEYIEEIRPTIPPLAG